MVLCFTSLIFFINAVQYPPNADSEMITEEKINSSEQNKTLDKSEAEESKQEPEKENVSVEVESKPPQEKEMSEKKLLDKALQTVLDSNVIIMNHTKSVDVVQKELYEIESDNLTLQDFMDRMDELCHTVCKDSQQAIWSFLIDSENISTKEEMISVTTVEDEVKEKYWGLLKSKYSLNNTISENPNLKRKLRILRQHATDVVMPQGKKLKVPITQPYGWTPSSSNQRTRLEWTTKFLLPFTMPSKQNNLNANYAHYYIFNIEKETSARATTEMNELSFFDVFKIGPIVRCHDKVQNKFGIYQGHHRNEIEEMQRIWSSAVVCTFDYPDCTPEQGVKTVSDIARIFKTSRNASELSYYWKSFRDATGKKIRPIFKKYVEKVNSFAQEENFTDAGDLWRFHFEDDDFQSTSQRLWSEVKELYDVLFEYVKYKLSQHYEKEMKDMDHIPAHLLGNLWGQEWLGIYSLVTPYPNITRPVIAQEKTIEIKGLFDFVDQFYKSMGFPSSKEIYENLKYNNIDPDCLSSSHDLCDEKNYRIRWCGNVSEDLGVNLNQIGRLLGHIQYFKAYKDQPVVFRGGPTPAFQEAIPDIVALQVTTPEYLENLPEATFKTVPETHINFLFWLALERLPLMGFAYVMDRWRWDAFANTDLVDLNKHWWDLRMKETGISPPVSRTEADLDPASKHHVASHVPYITHLISNVLEFQILYSLCKDVLNRVPLHKCSLYGYKYGGMELSRAMSYGASVDWKQVLKELTNETELSSKGILEYFKPLKEFLIAENQKRASQDMDTTTPIIVGIVLLILVILIIIVYCVKKHKIDKRLRNVCGLGKNGSLDITSEMTGGKVNEAVSVTNSVGEDKL